MACRLIGAKPLPEAMLSCCQLDPSEQTSAKFESKYKDFHSWKCIRKCRLRNGGHFVQGEMSYGIQHTTNLQALSYRLHSKNYAYDSPLTIFCCLIPLGLNISFRVTSITIGQSLPLMQPYRICIMMTSSNGKLFPSRRSVTGSFDAFFDLRLNKGLSKQSRRRWFEMPSHSLWGHCNVWMDLINQPRIPK